MNLDKKVFSTPSEVLYGHFNAPQIKAILFIENKLRENCFLFKPPYEIGQYSDLIGTLLSASNWSLKVVNSEWQITPKI
jgi:hypothetical protein